MYIPRPLPAAMSSEELDLNINLDIDPAPAFSTEVTSSTASSIDIEWAVSTVLPPAVGSPSDSHWPGLEVIRGFQVHYQKVASSYVQYSHLLPPSASTYSISNLVADTYYKVCVVMYRNDTSSPDRDCVDAATTSWHIPVSIGSSIGAMLALSIIVLIVLLSRCPSVIRHKRTSASESSKYDSMSSRFHDDHNEFSDTTTQCHDHDDDVFSDQCTTDSLPLDCSNKNCNHHHHHHHCVHAVPDPLCNGNKNHAFVGVGAGGVGGGVLPLRHHTHGRSQSERPRSLGSCGRTQSLERPRPHHSRRSQLMQLHSAHQSIQSEPGAAAAAPTGPTNATGNPSPRPLHVSISDLPPAVHVPDADAPVSSLLASGGARAKTNLKDRPRTFHMSIDSDI